MYYTYILKQKDKNHFYIGSTENLRKRIEEHDKGHTKSTGGRIWELHCYFAFRNEKNARNLERYLKTGSGRAFTKRHFKFQCDEALA